jgi:hypothetical protein
MAQIFHPSTNTISRLTIFGAITLLLVLVSVLAAINRFLLCNRGRGRPVPSPCSSVTNIMSIADDGIECRYCHTAVEQSSFAGIPSTKVYMNYHSQIWADSTVLEPVRESFRSGQSIPWTRVHSLPGFVYFDQAFM